MVSGRTESEQADGTKDRRPRPNIGEQHPQGFKLDFNTGLHGDEHTLGLWPAGKHRRTVERRELGNVQEHAAQRDEQVAEEGEDHQESGGRADRGFGTKEQRERQSVERERDSDHQAEGSRGQPVAKRIELGARERADYVDDENRADRHKEGHQHFAHNIVRLGETGEVELAAPAHIAFNRCRTCHRCCGDNGTVHSHRRHDIGRDVAVAGREIALIHAHAEHQVHGGGEHEYKERSVQHSEVAPKLPSDKAQQDFRLGFLRSGVLRGWDRGGHDVTSCPVDSVSEKKASSMPGWTILRWRITLAASSCSAMRSVSGVAMRIRCSLAS